MKTLAMLTTISSLFANTALAETVNFDAAKVDEAPAGWTCTKTGNGAPKWVVVADDTAPSKPKVLKQSGARIFSEGL
jgi:hypothetical protein